ncbi:MAG TPA: homoserine O-acetyltransferase [Gammaproteobacteria bacterium]
MKPHLTLHSQSPAPATAGARRLVTLPGRFRMRLGGELDEVQVAYEAWGRLSAAKDNVLLLFTGLSPSAHAASSGEDPSTGWWEEMLGPGKSIDTDRFHVICVNSLGSCYGSTGPASTDPRTGKPYGPAFPKLTIEDVASAAHGLLAALGIPRVRVVMGPSMGGMSALAYTIMYPGEVGVLVSISSATHSEPFSIAVRSLQRELIRTDGAWAGGHYAPGEGPREGMRLARKLGMISYRSAREWSERFGRERAKDAGIDAFGVEFEIEAYLESRAQSFIGAFDPNCYLYLSRAMDLFDVAEHGGSVDKALQRLRLQQALVIGVDSDILFPLHQQRALAESLRRSGADTRFLELASKQGHDSFLVDMERFRPAIGDFLETL